MRNGQAMVKSNPKMVELTLEGLLSKFAVKVENPAIVIEKDINSDIWKAILSSKVLRMLRSIDVIRAAG